jgi:hypothetical protein
MVFPEPAVSKNVRAINVLMLNGIEIYQFLVIAAVVHYLPSKKESWGD